MSFFDLKSKSNCRPFFESNVELCGHELRFVLSYKMASSAKFIKYTTLNGYYSYFVIGFAAFVNLFILTLPLN